jgi:hypothetical protein
MLLIWKTSAALPHRRECVRMSVAFLVAVTKSLVMLVNKSVLATQVLVQNGRANYFVRKLRAATIGTLISEPAIESTVQPI